MDERLFRGGSGADGKSVSVGLSFVLGVAALFTVGCSGTSTEKASISPPRMFDTGARAPDACGLLSARTVSSMITKPGARREDRGKGEKYCRWEDEAEILSPSTKGGMIQIDIFVQHQQIAGTEKYHEAKLTYRAVQLKRPCVALRSAADQSCWREGDSGLNLFLQKGYFTISFSCVVADQAAVRGERGEKLARMLADEILKRLPA